MENWQKEHIQKHLYDLVNYTQCNAELITSLRADNILGRADVDRLVSSTNVFVLFVYFCRT